MSDALKEFIDNHRDAFDSQDPDPRMLGQLKAELTGTGKLKKMKSTRLWWAAAVLVLILLSTSAYFIFVKKEIPVTAELSPADETTGINDPVYAKQIYQFRELIGLQQHELKQLEKEYPQLYHQFMGDMNVLDSAYQSLKIKLAENTNREILLEAMIQNLQLQSELLGRQLLIIKEIKQKNKRHEKNTI